MSKKKRVRSRARAALQKHVRYQWRPDPRAVRDADEIARRAGLRGADLAAAVVMLSLATPRELMSSGWLDPALQRAVLLVRGMQPLAATLILQQVIRDLQRRQVVTSPDAMVQLCNVEMRRRSLGAEPCNIEAPTPHPGEEDDLLESAAVWEAMALTEGFMTEMDLEPSRWLPAQVAIFAIVRDLAETQGVPVRLATIVPARLARLFDSHESPPGAEPIAPATLFQEAAEFVAWLGERGSLPPERAPTLQRQLRAFAKQARRDTRTHLEARGSSATE